MARAIRVEFEGAVYHVVARGNEQRDIFRADDDRRLFLATLNEAVHQHGIVAHAYCLMPNHYHLIVETPRGNLSQAIGWFQVTYTVRFNRRYERSGHLFQGRYKACLVDADSYAQQLVRYIHLNPVRPRDRTAVIPKDRKEILDRYEWSSHLEYAGLRAKPRWLSLSWLAYWGETAEKAHRSYRADMEESFKYPVKSPWEKLRGGLVLGGEELWEKAKSLVGAKDGGEEARWISHAGREKVREGIRGMAANEKDRRIRMWIRVRLGGERPVDVGREMGYGGGAGVLVAVKRLERAAEEDSDLRQRLDLLRKRVGMLTVES